MLANDFQINQTTAEVGDVGNRWNAAAAFRHAALSAGQIMDPDSLLALRVNGADLSLDHGYPARVIVPANPGVHNTKWVASLTFELA